ncbi:hypothetical protein [Aurantiacibacter flavus]|uniref:Uncharacterized protein n=1 Tax=Aurantiacibacter flavus TaxID=3145232 RepID=A0ABV0D1U0_9SPHN
MSRFYEPAIPFEGLRVTRVNGMEVAGEADFFRTMTVAGVLPREQNQVDITVSDGRTFSQTVCIEARGPDGIYREVSALDLPVMRYILSINLVAKYASDSFDVRPNGQFINIHFDRDPNDRIPARITQSFAINDQRNPVNIIRGIEPQHEDAIRRVLEQSSRTVNFVDSESGGERHAIIFHRWARVTSFGEAARMFIDDAKQEWISVLEAQSALLGAQTEQEAQRICRGSGPIDPVVAFVVCGTPMPD